MTTFFRLFRPATLAVFAGVLGILLWTNGLRLQHLLFVNSQGGNVEADASFDPLIVPGHSTESYHWLAQTQQMTRTGAWHLRNVDYENAPFGRQVYSTSPYRWWLLLLSKVQQKFGAIPPGQAVGGAALYADPLLHVLFLLLTCALLAWRLGPLAAAMGAFTGAFLFPFATEFLPGAPDDRGLAHGLALLSVLLVVLGIGSSTPAGSGANTRSRWFAAAGVAGGLGLWVGVSTQAIVLLGLSLGAVFATLLTLLSSTRKEPAPGKTDGLPWRTWAFSGALTILAAYAVEFAPDRLLSWDLASIHPLYATAWLGLGELLHRAKLWRREKRLRREPRDVSLMILSVLAVATVVVVQGKFSAREWFATDSQSLRLSKLAESAAAPNLGSWLARDGFALQSLSTLLPLLVLVPAFWSLFRGATPASTRTTLALALGPVLVALPFACLHLPWWNVVSALLLAVMVACLHVETRLPRAAWAGVFLLSVVPGGIHIVVTAKEEARNELSTTEVYSLVERDLSGWLALRTEASKAVLLAPPFQSTALSHFSGMRCLGSVSWENRDGVAAMVRILSAPSFQEAEELVQRREVTHVITFSWDSLFEDFARAGTGQIEGSLLDSLRTWKLPLWLRPLAYQLPKIAGFEGHSVTVFEVVETQTEANAQSRLAEYFVEMGNLQQASATAEGLRRFTGDFGTWVARSEVELANGDEAAFAKSLKLLQARLASKAQPSLPWDLRVSLAYVLAKGKQEKLCHDQVTACLASVDEAKLRYLSPTSLFRFLVMTRSFGLRLSPELDAAALKLLPPELRQRFK